MRQFEVEDEGLNSWLTPWKTCEVRRTRRGQFWIPGDRVELNMKTFQRGPMFVTWEAPESVTRPYPIVLVHGGAMQGTEWMDTPDGRPGWAQRLVEDGYAVFTVDRPSQGRSPFSSEIVGKMGPAFSYEEGEEVFYPTKSAARHTQFPFDTSDKVALDTFVAAFGPLPVDIEVWQTMDADRLTKLLDRIGPSILFTHSASGSDGWLVADRRPNLIAAIVTIEPMGPPFGNTPNIGTLAWGITGIPIAYDPPQASPETAKAAKPQSLTIPALMGVPVAVVSGETSAQSIYAPKMLEFLLNAGASAELIHLPDFGILGNGHGLIYEKNSDDALQPVLRWLEKSVSTKKSLEEGY